MDVVMVVMRLVHIISGVIWAGGAVAAAAFINPTAKALKQDAAPFVQHLNFVRKFPAWLGVFGTLTVLSGLVMYWRLFEGIANLNTGTGLALTVGSLAGIIALGMAFGVLFPTSNQLQALGKEIAAGGGPPSPEQQAQAGALQEKLMNWAVIVTVTLVIAMIGMSLSEYFAF